MHRAWRQWVRLWAPLPWPTVRAALIVWAGTRLALSLVTYGSLVLVPGAPSMTATGARSPRLVDVLGQFWVWDTRWYVGIAHAGYVQASKDLLRKGAAKRLHLEQLPGYAPELKPDAGIWNSLKRVELGNCCCPDLAAHALALRRAKERLRHKRTVIQACVRQAGYYV